MGNISIFEKPSLFSEINFTNSVAVVIDVLRATSTILTALHHGCKYVYPVNEIDKAIELKNKLNDPGILLCGERDGKRINGFDLGNSPFEFTNELVFNRSLIMTTTNGTRALLAACSAEQVFVLALLNLNSLAHVVAKSDFHVNILCAGTNGSETLEDSVCAGLFAMELMSINSSLQLIRGNEIVKTAMNYQNNLLKVMRDSKHGKYLASIGFTKDLEYCAGLNTLNIIAEFKNNYISLINQDI